MAQSPDVVVSNQGTVVSFTLLTPEARQFVEEQVQAEPYQFLGSSLVVDYRYARDLAQGMIDDGLVLA